MYQERITEEALELDEIENTASLKLYPNPYKMIHMKLSQKENIHI